VARTTRASTSAPQTFTITVNNPPAVRSPARRTDVFVAPATFNVIANAADLDRTISSGVLGDELAGDAWRNPYSINLTIFRWQYKRSRRSRPTTAQQHVSR
jgi:hypothetical protein